jgi:probable rRNA maturation factor
MISIDFIDVEESSELVKTSEKAANQSLTDKKCDLSIVFCNDRYIQGLNSQFRNIDKATDVLSFPSEETDPESGNRYMGDIVISYEHAVAQAQEAGNPVLAEISMLVVHGVLHLLGYDHGTAEEKQYMWSVQSDILSSLGIKMDKFTGDE